MCCLFLALDQHPALPLIIAANRDEYYQRPTLGAQFWEGMPQMLAGRDLEQDGTWLGVTRDGRFGAVTNFRDTNKAVNGARSRGHLVKDFLLSEDCPDEYVTRVAAQSHLYNGFSLMVGSTAQVMYYSNRGRGPQRLISGLYGLSNHLLDTAWPKIVKGKAELKRLLRTPSGPSTDDLLQLLEDHTVAGEEHRPTTDLELDQELDSRIFVRGEAFGTRCSTVIRLNVEGVLEFKERTFFNHSSRPTTVEYQLQLPCPGTKEPRHLASS